MWYPPQQQQQQQQQPCWNGYIHHLSPQKQQQHQQPSYARTSYLYCNNDDSLNTIQATTSYGVPGNDENESLIHYHSTRVDDVYATGADYYVTTATGSYSYDMSSSLPYQTSTTHWNPVISAPIKTSIVTPNHHHQNDIQTIQPSSSASSPPSSTACWDWLLYPPEIYSYLYIPSSSFIQSQHSQDDYLDLSASLPTWLLALLYPSMKQFHLNNDENESDQEISSLNSPTMKIPDEPLVSMNIEKKSAHVSSNLSLSSELSVNNGQKSQQNRSSTPDTDDGYQSASDASRSDYSQQSSLPYDRRLHHHSRDDLTINMLPSLMPKRISYAAAAKPIVASTNPINKISPSPTPIIRTKNNSSLISSNEILNNNNNLNGQKSKFIAPRFERMHHAKQYSSTTMTITNDCSLSSTNRTQIRSNHNQRQHVVHSSRRR